MSELVQLHVWVQNKRMNWTEPEVINPHSGKPQPGKRIVLDVEPGTSVPEMKVAIAKELEQLGKELLYFYVVAVVEKDDGTFVYRTIVKKSFPEKEKVKKRKR